MRRLFVVVALLGVMLIMRSFQMRIDAPANVITLAAIGFVVLTTFAVADMGTRLSLPRVTGFIVTGVALGPSAANILSTEVVAEMRMFNTLALGLIATSAGLELNLKALIPLFKTLGTTTAMKVLLGIPLVGLTLFGMSHLVDVGVSAFETRAALAIVMGVLSIGTSPSIALAILTETKSKGRLSDLVLGAAVFKDLVVVVCLAIGVAVAGTLLDANATADSSVLLHVTRELGGSLIAGAILGGVLIAYIRFIQAEMLLFVAAMILVVAELCRVFHLELLLVFIAAGFVVRNFSHYEHVLMKPLEVVALPVFVVFFTIAGASIQVATTWSILPAALAVCLVRSGVYWVAAWVGNSVGKESPAIKRNAWAAYLPQAGVTLGLVAVAAEKLPALSAEITTTGMAIVAINLLVGPVSLRLALSRAGEIPGSKLTSVSSATATPLATLKSWVPTEETSTTEPLDEQLLSYVNELQRSTHDSLLLLLKSENPPTVSFELNEEPGHDVRLAIVRAYRKAASDWYESWVDRLDVLPVRVLVTRSEASLVARKTDSAFQRVRLWWLRTRWQVSKSARTREVLVRLCARMTVEPTVARLAARMYEAALEGHFAASKRSTDAAGVIPETWQLELEQAFTEFSRLLDAANGPRMPSRALRFSDVEQLIRSELAPLDETRDELYATRTSAIWGSEVARHQLAALSEVVVGSVNAHLTVPARDVLDRLEPSLRQLASHFLELLKSREALLSGPTKSSASWKEQLTATRQRTVDEFARGLRVSVAMRDLGAAFRAEIERLPTELRCYQLTVDGDVRNGTIRRINLQEVAEKHLVKRLIPLLDQSVRGLSNTFAHLPRDVRDILEPALVQLEASSEDAAASAQLEVQVRATIARLDVLIGGIRHQVDTELKHQHTALQTALSGMEREVTTAQLLGETTTHRLRQLVGQLSRRFQRLLELRPAETTNAADDDARRTSRLIQRWRYPHVVEIVARWFSQRPVRDERIYSDQAAQVDRVLEAESRWRQSEQVSLLVRGEIGSGKTSLLNMCELELHNPRVFRLDAEGPEQSRTLQEALANVLGCRPTETAITYALALQKPILLIDNLSVWLARSPNVFDELSRLLVRITRTPEAFWIVAIDPALQARFGRFIAVHSAFTSVIDLASVTRKDLELMVTSRAARANQTLSYKPTPLGRVLRRVGLPGDELLYFILLSRASRGNPGRALALALMSATSTDHAVELDARLLRPVHPHLGDNFTASQLALLKTLLECGTLDLRSISLQVGVDVLTAELDLAFLQSCGVVFKDSRVYEIPDNVRWVVSDELERLGAMTLTGDGARRRLHRRQRVGRSIAVAAGLIPALYFLVRWTKEATLAQWALTLAGLILLFFPTVQNVTSGLMLRWFAGLHAGDTLSSGSARGTVERVGYTHLRLLTSSGEPLLVPYRTLAAQSLVLYRGTPRGARVQARLTQTPASPAFREVVFRLAHLCPYRVPDTPVVVRRRGSELVVDVYSWHRHSSKVIEGFLNAHTAGTDVSKSATALPESA